MSEVNDRTTLGINRRTLRRFTRFMTELMCEKGRRLDQDEALNSLLDRADKSYVDMDEILRR